MSRIDMVGWQLLGCARIELPWCSHDCFGQLLSHSLLTGSNGYMIDGQCILCNKVKQCLIFRPVTHHTLCSSHEPVDST